MWLTVHASDAKTPEAAWHELVTTGFADLLIEPIQTEQYGKPALVGQPIEAT